MAMPCAGLSASRAADHGQLNRALCHAVCHDLSSVALSTPSKESPTPDIVLFARVVHVPQSEQVDPPMPTRRLTLPRPSRPPFLVVRLLI